MRVFTYGIEANKMDAIRWTFGKAEYIDVTDAYQDILALCADVVIMAVDHTPEDIIATIKEFQEEVSDDDDTEYHYVTDEEFNDWFKEYYSAFEDSIEELADTVTREEFEALHLIGIQKYHGGIISHVYIDEDVKHYEFYRPEVGKRELLILSLGDNLIESKTYHSYEDRYDIVSVACYKEKMSKKGCLWEIFEDRTPITELPPILWKLKEKFDKVTDPYVYAYFGE